MKNIFKILSLFCLLNVGSALAELTQAIDRTDISAGETFVLDIQMTDSNDESPDLSMIPAYITVVSNSQYQHTQIINGRRSSIKGWKLKLKTLKSGKVVIPAIAVGTEFTQPIVLDVKKSSFSADVNGEKQAIFLKAEVDQTSPFVQQQIVYTISLYRSVSTQYENLTAPVVENSIVEKLGDDAVFDTVINNKRYTVYQRKYIIFPQQSGQIEIGAVNFTADVNDSSRQSRSLFLNSTRPISVSTDPILLSVKPKPVAINAPWLPAESVSLTERWSTSATDDTNLTAAPNELKVGEPITWTLLMTVQGQSESQLPELTIPKVDGLQIYPDTPNKERKVNAKGILSQRIEKFAVIPSKEGELTIPSIEVKWWDTKNQIEKTASLPARTFKVLPGKVVKQTAIDLPQLPVATPPVTIIDDSQTRAWQGISLGLLLLWILTLIAYFRKPKTTSTISVNEQASTSTNHSLSYQETLKNAKNALKSQSAKDIAIAVINLVNSLDKKQYHSLGAIAHDINDQNISNKLNKIEEQRFSNNQNNFESQLNQEDLTQLTALILKPTKNVTSDLIPPLYSR